MKSSVIALLSFPLLLFGIRLMDYKVSESSAQVLSTGLNYHFGMTEGEVVSHFGNFSLNFERFQATIPWSYNLNFFGNVNGNFLPPEESDTVDLDTVRQFSYQAQWEAKYNRYLVSGKDFLAFAKLEGDLATTYDYPATQATIGLGYGRFVNSTPLARALRIEEEMLKQGTFVDSLPTGTLLNFAKALAPEYTRTYHEKYYYWEREYYSALETILNESNLLYNSQLGSTGSLIIKDVLAEYISPRYYGYEVNFGVGYDLIPAYRNVGRAAFASLAFNFARPFGFRTQFIEKSNIRLPFTGGKFGKEMHGELLASLYYEVKSMVDVIGTYQFNIDRVISDTTTGKYSFLINNHFSVTFSYLIVDHLVMSNKLTLGYSSGAKAPSLELSSAIDFRFF